MSGDVAAYSCGQEGIHARGARDAECASVLEFESGGLLSVLFEKSSGELRQVSEFQVSRPRGRELCQSGGILLKVPVS